MVSSISGSDTSSYYLSQMREKLFSTVDTDGDSSLSSAELTSLFGTGSQAGSSADNLISSLDTDGDGAIGQLEFNAGLSRLSQEMKSRNTEDDSSGSEDDLFSKIDSDGNGVIDDEEFSTFRSNMAQNGPPPPPPSSTTDETSAESSSRDLFTQFDEDGSGGISESEFTAEMTSLKKAEEFSTGKDEELFGEVDSNGDGSISTDEMSEFQALMANNGPPAGPPPPDATNETSSGDMFSKMDIDGSGDISEAEFNTAMEDMRSAQASSSSNEIDDSKTTSSSTSTTSATADESIGADLEKLLYAAMNSYMGTLSNFRAESISSTSAYV